MVREMERDTTAQGRKTARDTVFRRRGSGADPGRGRAAYAALLLILGCAVLFPPFSGIARAADEGDSVLPDSGIHYPGGFDPNTVGEVRGTASRLTRPERGPVRFRLDSERDTYTVLAAPAWFWNDLKIELPDGTRVRVQGSKSLGRDGNLYIIAQEVEIERTRKNLAFRDDGGFPLWKGSGAGRTGRGNGIGSPMGGPGGMRGGPGGATRGHR